MKDFKKFLEEVTIKGNPGIPGQGGRRSGERDYLSDIERRAKTRLGVNGGEFPREMQRIGGQIMQLVHRSNSLCRGKEKQLEKLAEEIIILNYQDILDGVKLDIKFAQPREITQNLQGDPDENVDLPSFREVTDPDLIKRIHKAKLSNTIIQGEAKNTKHIIHTDEVKDGLKDIFGNNWQEVFNIWDEISKIADKMDWIIPIDIKTDMMERQPEGMAGSVSVKWEPKEDDDNDDDNKEEDDNYDIEDDNIEDDIVEYAPVIRARGVDFPMLIHEAVKGIYELIAAVSMPEEGASDDEIRKAETIKINVSSFEDEAEDFRTGPEIASDLRDFINLNPKSSQYKNIREYFFGKIMDDKYLSTDEFLELFRGILNKTADARKKVDSIISDIIDELDNYERSQVLGNQESDDEYVIDNEEEHPVKEIETEVDYTKLSQRKIHDLIDDALDAGDFEKVKLLTSYIKEGKQLYLREIEMINEKRKNNK